MLQIITKCWCEVVLVLSDVCSGICYFFIEVVCASKDLHSGVFGGTVYVSFALMIVVHVK